MEPFVKFAPINVKVAVLPQELVQLVLMPITEMSTKIVLALLDSSIVEVSTVLLARQLVSTVQVLQLVLLVMPPNSESSTEPSVPVLLVTTSSITLISLEHVKNAMLNV